MTPVESFCEVVRWLGCFSLSGSGQMLLAERSRVGRHGWQEFGLLLVFIGDKVSTPVRQGRGAENPEVLSYG